MITKGQSDDIWGGRLVNLSVTRENILAVSLTVNGCVLCYFGVMAATAYLAKRIDTLIGIYRDKGWLIGKLLTEQIFLWIIFVLGVVSLCVTDVMQYPFYHYGNGTGATPAVVVRVVFSMNIGKYLYITFQDLVMSKHCGLNWAILVHHLVTVVCYTAFVTFGQNSFLAICGVLMEAAALPVAVAKLWRAAGRSGRSPAYRRIIFSGCLVTSFFRGFVPLAFLVFALTVQNPFNMAPAPLVFFFLALIFFASINVWLITLTIAGYCRLVSPPPPPLGGLPVILQRNHLWPVGKKPLRFLKNNLNCYPAPATNELKDASGMMAAISNKSRQQLVALSLGPAPPGECTANKPQNNDSESTNKQNSCHPDLGP